MFVVIGSTTLDIFMTGLDRLPTPGGDEFTPDSIAFTDMPPSMTLGGNGANTTYVAAGLGMDTALCSVVADDAAGRMLGDWLTDRGVGLDGLLHTGSATSMTIVATDRERTRLSFHHPGSGRTYGPSDVPAELIERADTVLLTGYHLLLGMRGTGGVALLRRARAAGAVIAVDVGPIVPPPAVDAEWSALLPETDYFIGNEYELLTCTGAPTLDSAADLLLGAGVLNVVAKRGSGGSSGFSGGGRVDAAGFEVDVLSTVGAGDSFNAGFFAARARGYDLASSLRLANAVAALVVSSGRGILDAPSFAEAAALVGRDD